MAWSLLSATAWLAAGAASPIQVPTVTLDWVGIHEMALCPPPTDEARLAAAKDEAEQRLPAFRAAWAKHGPALLRETRALVGYPFKFNETLATLHVCEAHGDGTSYPLTVNLTLFLKVYGGEFQNHPHAEELFANLVYHEVLHRYIRDIVGPGKGEPMRPTPLVARHSDENLFVRTHLHLIGIEKLVYKRLRRAEIPAIMWSDNKHPAYARAHALANEVGAETILADLRGAAASGRGER